MQKTLLWRRIHRWMGLVIGIQILFWMASGLYFSLVPIEMIRGEHFTVPPRSLKQAEMENLLSPSQVLGRLQLSQAAVIDSLSLALLRQRLVYRIETSQNGQRMRRLLDARSGEILPMLTREEAIAGAGAALNEPLAVRSVLLVDAESSGSEYRGRELPLYRVDLEHRSGLRLYLDAWTGEVVARRTSAWRLFDFLWMLHIMDFDERDNFNHSLLQLFAMAGLLVTIAGYILWWLSSSLRRRRGHGRTREESA